MFFRSFSIRLYVLTATLAANTYAQTVTPGGVVNAADYNSPVAPGSVIAIFGANLAASTVASSSAPMATTLGGTSVLINGAPAPLFAVSPGQINAQLPVDTPLGTASLVVNGSAPVSFPVAVSAPGIITYGNNRAIVINQDYSLNSPDHPALTGAWATVYLTGQGPVNPAVRSGMASPSNPVAVPTLPVSATIGGKPADVMFAGLTPGGVGLFQVNLRIPSMASGDYPLMITVGQAVSNAPLIAVSTDGSPVLSVVRTIAYHQITSLPDAPVYRDSMAMSGDGTVIAYSHDAGPNQIYAMNFDGTGQRMVDSYKPLCSCGSTVVISDDGSRIVSSEGIQIRQGGQPLLVTDDNAAGHSAYISGLAIEGDGRRVFFLVGRDTTIAGTKPVFLQRGLYVMEGSGMRQIVGPDAVAGLLGTTASSYYSPEFGTGLGHSLGVTVDGAHIVFSAGGNGYGPEGIFGVNLDISGLHFVLGPVRYVDHLAISGNGAKVLYVTTNSSFVVETGAVNFDGTGALRLRQDGLGEIPGVQLSADGKLLLAYDILYNTDGSGVLELGTLLNWFTLGSPSTAGNAVMNATATRFVYPWVPPHAYSQGFSQLVTAEINPKNLGAAPQLSNVSVNPDYAVAGGSVQGTVSAAITPHDHVLGVNYALVLNGVVEDPVNGDIALTDGGSGIFSSKNVIARSTAPAGPRLLRLFAWASDAGGMQHGTLVDITPFSVVLEPPAGGGH
jgi:uncharacterized protein (TIGR03437 family)